MALTDYVQRVQARRPGPTRKIQRAERLFMEHGALSCILLFCPACPSAVLPDLPTLHTAGQLSNTEHRIRSTAP